MVKMIVRKSQISGSAAAPPSKSYTHRAIICAALADGISTISNPLFSDDAGATLAACEALGAEILEKSPERIVIKGTGGSVGAGNATIDCRESGSTLRFMIPLAALSGKEITFTGKPGLAKRPINDLLEALTQLGVRREYVNKNNMLPVRIFGSKTMEGGRITIRGDVSSQFVSGLLFALPLAEGDSEISLIGEVVSRDYIAITLDVLEKFGIRMEHSDDFRSFKIKGNQRYNSREYLVEGDYSSAAFLLAAGALAGKVTVTNLDRGSKQGDRRIVDILRSMEAKITAGEDYVSVEKSGLTAAKMDARDIPDLVPVLSILATQASGTTEIANAGRLRMKESDRLSGMLDMIKALRGKASLEGDSILIEGKTPLGGAEVETLADHRLVMAACVAGLVAEGETTVGDPTAIKKSYPAFFDDFRKLGADVNALSDGFGNALKLRTIGESHGKRIGAILEGVPAGVEVTRDFIQSEVDRRRSTGVLTTQRKEADAVAIVSGIENGKTTGGPIRLEIENKDIKSEAYERIRDTPRPGHADYTARGKYASVFDYRGGGFLSGRMTVCFVAAGAIAKRILEKEGIRVLAHTVQVGNVKVDRAVPDEEVEQNRFSNPVRCADLEKAKEMERAIENARSEGDSLGGIVECRILGVPMGVGEPVFNSVESALSQAMFSIPAVKGIEFGSGFKGAGMRGSENNDPFRLDNGRIITVTNNSGGILGGISNGMPIVFRIAVKPTSSIAKEQDTVNLHTMQPAKISVLGRHDPCVAIRAPPVVEAMAALTVADLLMEGGFLD